jgi:hypothetical protein
MRKAKIGMLLTAILGMAMMVTQLQAASIPLDGELSIAAASTNTVETKDFTSSAMEIDRIVIGPCVGATGTVSVAIAAMDIGVATSLGSASSTTNSGSAVTPMAAVVVGSTTNLVRIATSTIRFTITKAANPSAVTIPYRIIARQ